MTTTDETWTRLILRDNVTGQYYRHPEHGGLTLDSLSAEYCSQRDLLTTERIAKEAFPSLDFVPVRLTVDVQPFSARSLEVLRENSRREIKRTALAKLTVDEHAALGVQHDIT